MLRECIETGKTVDNAIEAACTKMGCSRDEVGFEIIDLPKKVLFGLMANPARVKVWIESAEQIPEASAPAVMVSELPVKKEIKAPIDAKIAGKSELMPIVDKAQTKEPEAKKEKLIAEIADGEYIKTKAISIESLSDHAKAKTQLACDYLVDICDEMGIKAECSLRSEDNGICIELRGTGMGTLIGRRGETLDALQYLTGLVANRSEGEYLRITVDCGDYRLKRRATLEALAKKLSSQVLKTNVSKMLEPMNPFERRIIHATVSEIEGVSSISVGEEHNRRVLITSPTSKRIPRDENPRSERAEQTERRDRRGGSRPPRHGGSGERRSSTMGGSINTISRNRGTAPVVKQIPAEGPKPTPEAANGAKSLYAKLDLE